MKHTILSIIFCLTGVVRADELAATENSELAYILPNFQLLQETGPPKSAVSIRILKVQDMGECDGSPQTCPKSAIYITASEYGEHPIQKTYVLPKMHGWDFVEWIEFTEYEGPDNYVIFKLKAQVPNKSLSKSWWKDELYLLKVNYHNGKWEKL